jgi:sodium-dependent phosphate cotransporter
MNCTEDSYSGCGKSFGLISCDKKSGDCPAFFQSDASAKDDKVSGGVVFFISIVILFTCLVGLVTVLQKMLLGMSSRIVYKATNINGYLAIVIGTGITMVVQSSSITTSTLTPLVGMGALRLEQMLPLTLGANNWNNNDCHLVSTCHRRNWISPGCTSSFVLQLDWYCHLVSPSFYAQRSA